VIDYFYPLECVDVMCGCNSLEVR